MNDNTVKYAVSILLTALFLCLAPPLSAHFEPPNRTVEPPPPSSGHRHGGEHHRLPHQPYENKTAWDWVAPINGAGYCGPAALYHIILYYGDSGPFYLKHPSGRKGSGRPVEITSINRKNPMFVDDSSFGKFIQPYGTGSTWSMLKKAADLRRSENGNEPVYDSFVCSRFTRLKDSGTRLARLNHIREQFLDRDIPVVIHLASTFPLPGHYVTLIGFNPDTATVYYADSLHNTSGIRAVPLDQFLNTRFYVSGKHYKARWDGEWMAIWHPGAIPPCDRCGE
jgi:hypothetical protein